MGNRADDMTGTHSGRTPPPPPPTKDQRERWDAHLRGLTADMVRVNLEVRDIQETLSVMSANEDVRMARIALLDQKQREANRWALIRDLIIITLIVVLGSLVSYNTTQFWHWN